MCLKKGDFVRVKRGLYKNDVGLVINVDADLKDAILKLIPRLELVQQERKHNVFGN